MQRDDMLVTFADVSDFTVPWYLYDFSLQDCKSLNNTGQKKSRDPCQAGTAEKSLLPYQA